MRISNGVPQSRWRAVPFQLWCISLQGDTCCCRVQKRRPDWLSCKAPKTLHCKICQETRLLSCRIVNTVGDKMTAEVNEHVRATSQLCGGCRFENLFGGLLSKVLACCVALPALWWPRWASWFLSVGESCCRRAMAPELFAWSGLSCRVETVCQVVVRRRRREY